MPRLRRVRSLPRDSGGVPEELHSRLHPVWRDDAAIRRLCDELGLSPKPWMGPLTAFRAVVTAFAESRGWGHALGAHYASAGIPMFYCALENRERRWELGPPLVMTAEHWEFIDATERRILDGTIGQGVEK